MATAKISQLKFAPTDHTLAVLSRVADQEGVTDAKVAAPSGIRIVASVIQTSAAAPTTAPSVHIPAEYLRVASVDFARELVLEPGAGVDATRLVSPGFTAPASAGVAPGGATVTVTISPGNPSSSAIDFWVLFEEATPADPANPARRMAKGTIAAVLTMGSATIMQSIPASGQGGSPKAIDPGTYNAVALVAGYAFHPQQVTVT